MKDNIKKYLYVYIYLYLNHYKNKQKYFSNLYVNTNICYYKK